MPFNLDIILTGITQEVGQVFILFWWLITPLILVIIFWRLWMFHIQNQYIEGIKWVLLKIKVPQDVTKSPRAMEQVFAAVHGSYSFGLKFVEKYWQGKVEDWHSFEIVGNADGVHFYIRTAENYRDMIESAVYSQYPEAEIEIVDDYIGNLPVLLPNNAYDLFGSEFILVREDGYPIKTYTALETIEKEEKLDSLATLFEVMSRLKRSGQIWVQIIVRPTDDSWKRKAEALRDKLAGRKEAKKTTVGEKIVEFVTNLIMAPFREPQWAEASKSEKPSLSALTKGEQAVIQAIDNKASKIGFESVLRFIYLDEKMEFNHGIISGIMGALRQFSTLNLNGLRPNLDTMTVSFGKLRKIFKKQRVYAKKRRIYENYRLRAFPSRFSILNTEELATLYHFPSFVVGAPGLRPIEFKKSVPPLNLPTEQ